MKAARDSDRSATAVGYALAAAAVAIMLGYFPSLSSPFVAPKLAVLLVAGACGFLGWAAGSWRPRPAPRDRAGPRLRPNDLGASTAFGLLTVVTALLAAGRGAPGAPYAAGRAHPHRGDVRGGRRRGLRGARRRPQRAAALRGDSRQRGAGGADWPLPAPPSLAAADPVDQRPRLDVRQPERRRRSRGDGDPVRVRSARLRRNDRPRAVAVASPDDRALSGAGDRLPGRGARARRLAGRRARDRGLLRAPPSSALTRDRRRRGRGRDAGGRRRRRFLAAGPPTTRSTSNDSSRPRAWSATPSIRARRSRAPVWRSGAGHGRSTVRSR